MKNNVNSGLEKADITLAASKTTIKADGSDSVTLSVKRNDDNTDVTTESTIYVNGTKLNGTTFTTTNAGTYTLYAERNEVKSNEITITAEKVATGKTIVFAEGVDTSDGWYDVNKKGQGNNGDMNMCWAAASSNMIQWWQDRYVAAGNKLPSTAITGPGTKSYDNYGPYELALMEIYHSNWNNSKGGHPEEAIPWYLPGSTFKPVTAVAALESGVITDTEKIFNPGRYWEKPYIKTTAPIGYYNLYNGMALSDNVYFQELGNRAGIDNIAKYGEMLGLDGSTGIDLAYESSGTRATEGLPTPEKRDMYQQKAAANQGAYWDKKIEEAEASFAKELANATTEEEKAKIERRRRSTISIYQSEKVINMKWASEWHAADTFNVSIGQGRQNYTPLQLAVYAASLANGGTVYQPYVVDKVVDDAGNIVLQNTPIVKQQADISEETLRKVKEAMCRVTSAGGGASGLFAHFPSDIRVAAKTGTAQPGRAGYIVGNKQYYDGLFICYAPADNPQVAFACVMEYGYSGSGSAGYVAKAVLEEYFALNQPLQNTDPVAGTVVQ
ncbi:MAG: IdeS/Mac family cysteine endopeptidase [Peptococcaceae bacterium]|nr:IdeS/Mac family cysteine endopeptidase [Peptococcaceae bacterium]